VGKAAIDPSGAAQTCSVLDHKKSSQ
jgi:hypothetical protein